MAGGRSGKFGCTADNRRWGRMSAALWFKWRLPVDFWNLSECVEGFRLGRGLLEREFADGGFLDQKVWQVFVMVGLICGEG